MSFFPPPFNVEFLKNPKELARVWANWLQRISKNFATIVTGATSGNLATLDNSGDLEDSGYAPDDFSLTTHDHPFVRTDGTRDIENTESWNVGDVDGGNYTEFETTGAIEYHGSARGWRCRVLKPQIVKIPAANGPAEDTIDGFSFHRYDRGNEESVYYVFSIPHNYAEGDVNVRGYFEFVVENPPAGGGNDEVVVMGFEYKKIADGDVFDFTAGTTTGTISETIAAGETAEILHQTVLGTCSTTGWKSGDQILFRFFRDATNVADTYDNEGVAANNDVWVNMYHLEYLSNKLGEHE